MSFLRPDIWVFLNIKVTFVSPRNIFANIYLIVSEFGKFLLFYNITRKLQRDTRKWHVLFHEYVLQYTVEVQIADNSTLRGELWTEQDDLPKLMQPVGAERIRTCRTLYRALVILQRNNLFVSRLISYHPHLGHWYHYLKHF